MLVDAHIKICPICKMRRATQLHHLFGQAKQHRKIYGSLIDQDFNLLPVCEHCHVSHKDMAGRIESELWFRSEAEKHGFPLPPPSKTLQTKMRYQG